MTRVVDASVVVAWLVDRGAEGEWASRVMALQPLAGPHSLPVEVASTLRRMTLAGKISSDVAALAYEDLIDLQVDLHPYAPFARRIWDLRANVTPYDAWYVALAESLGAPLATLDTRLARSPGLRCRVVAPPTAS